MLKNILATFLAVCITLSMFTRVNEPMSVEESSVTITMCDLDAGEISY